MKRFKLLVLIVICLFIGILNVKADGLRCIYYDAKSTDAILSKNIFQFETNKKVVQYQFMGSLQNYSSFMTHNDNEFKVDSCPSQVYYFCTYNTYTKEYPYANIKGCDISTKSFSADKLKTPNAFNGIWNLKKEGDAESGQEVEYSYEKTLLTTYTNLQNASEKISIKTYNVSTTGLNFEVNLNTTGITISNLEQYKTVFLAKKTNNYPKYVVYSGGTYSFTDTKPTQFDKIFSNTSSIPIIQEEVFNDCEELFGGSTLQWLNDNIFIWIRIAVPIILILFTTIDFSKVVFTDDKEGLQNAFRRFIRRSIAAVLIFITPTLIILIAQIIDPKGNDLGAVSKCVETMEKLNNTSN